MVGLLGITLDRCSEMVAIKHVHKHYMYTLPIHKWYEAIVSMEPLKAGYPDSSQCSLIGH